MPRLKSPKNKGSDFERSLAAYLRTHGIDAHRAPLSGGGTFAAFNGGGQSDITGTPDLWIECKRVERLNFREALAQAERGIAKSKSTDVPVVINRRNREALPDAVVALRLRDFITLYTTYLHTHGYAFLPPPADPGPAC